MYVCAEVALKEKKLTKRDKDDILYQCPKCGGDIRK